MLLTEQHSKTQFRSETAQQIKLATESSTLGLVSATHVVERENKPWNMSSDLHIFTHVLHTYMYTHTHTLNKMGLKNIFHCSITQQKSSRLVIILAVCANNQCSTKLIFFLLEILADRKFFHKYFWRWLFQGLHKSIPKFGMLTSPRSRAFSHECTRRGSSKAVVWR